MANTGKYAGSETEKNLYAAFAGETQARSKYTYFASVAKKQGFEQIAELFQRSTRSCGLRSSAVSGIRRIIF